MTFYILGMLLKALSLIYINYSLNYPRDRHFDHHYFYFYFFKERKTGVGVEEWGSGEKNTMEVNHVQVTYSVLHSEFKLHSSYVFSTMLSIYAVLFLRLVGSFSSWAIRWVILLLCRKRNTGREKDLIDESVWF